MKRQASCCSWEILRGDCIQQMAEMEEASVDAVVCDPPYGIGFMGNVWDGAAIEEAMQERASQAQPAHKDGSERANPRMSRAEAAGKYDLSLTANRRYQGWCEVWAREAFRVLKPGGHLLASCGTRTYHRMAAGIEDAGFEIRDSLMFLYGSGFPKSHNLDRLRGEQFCGCEAEPTPEHDLRDVPDSDVPAPEAAPGREGAVLLEGLSQPGAPEDRPEAGDGDEGEPQSGLERRCDLLAEEGQLPADQIREGAQVGIVDGSQRRVRNGAPAADGNQDRPPAGAGRSGPSPRPRSAEQRAKQLGAVADQRLTQDGRGWPDCPRCGLPVIPRGIGTALKPAHEPIVVARKPLIGTVAANFLEHGTGGINVDGCRLEAHDDQLAEKYASVADAGPRDNAIFGRDRRDRRDRRTEPHGAGRWPANVLLSHAEDCVPVGVVSVNSDGHHPSARGKGDLSTAGHGGQDALDERRSAGETVEAWECAPGCPVAELDAQSGELKSGGGDKRGGSPERWSGGWAGRDAPTGHTPDHGGASRFFYCAKTSRAERNAGLEGFDSKALNWSSGEQSPGSFQSENTDRTVANSHPTVKPINLMRWLCRLVTPPGGLILDPFLGSGTTGCAAVLEGFDFIGVEREAEYIAIAEARIAFWAQHAGKEVGDVLKLNAVSAKAAKVHAERGQRSIEEVIEEGQAAA